MNYSVEKRITQICAYNLVAQLKSLTKLVNRPGLEEHTYIYLKSEKKKKMHLMGSKYYKHCSCSYTQYQRKKSLDGSNVALLIQCPDTGVF